MYAQFFGLNHEPFSIAPDPRYLFMSERHREALAHLLYGVSGGGGFVLLSGEIGTGKTTVCRCFLEQIPANCNVAYIFNPKLTAQELLRSVCDEFHVPYRAADAAAPPSSKDYVDALNAFLLAQHAAGKDNVLVIDEAQNLSADVLEQLRLLTNLETSERKLLQIMLIGQPELRAMLARPELEQLSQRVLARFHLDALSEAETVQYIQHRLSVAGLRGPVPFDRKALQRIQQITTGVPRRINLLCDRAMLGAYATGKGTIDKAIVNKAATEVFEDPALLVGTRSEPSRWVLLGAGLAAGVVLAGAMALVLEPSLMDRLRGRDAPAAAVRAPVALPATPGAQASMTAPAASGSVLPAAGTAPFAMDIRSGFRLLPSTQAQALRELGTLWNLELAGDDPCAAALREQVQCQKDNATLETLRRLDRPVLLALQDADGQKAWALLGGVNDRTVTLRSGAGAGATPVTVPLASLDTVWNGDYVTLWRSPPGFRDRLGDRGAAVDWLAARLAMAEKAPPPRGPHAMDRKMLARVKAFQNANGLKADGLAGPMTFMLLNRATGVEEPHLNGER
ncbi:MAG: peptidoglycan-binding protein [Comamonadaceae bacterium]|nr:MAG: peptidoglycan-binding protein [Comamonadaceae bacterium]